MPPSRVPKRGFAVGPTRRGKGTKIVAVAAGNSLQQLIATHPAEPYTVACAYAYRGELDQAFTWLDRAFERHDVSLIEFRTDPLLRKLYLDPRFAALIHGMKI
jgi:hypothetical protein